MERLWEIDFLRGIFIIPMVAFNYMVALRYFGIYAAAGSWHYQWLLPRIIASAFILLAGVSLWISWSRNPSAKRVAMRGGRILLYGMMITAVTWLFYPPYAVLFGILHLIGISITLSVPFLKKKAFIIPVIIIFLAGFYIDFLYIRFSPLFPIIPQDFQTFDYFPVMPWFGVFLLGIYVGSRLYSEGKRKYNIRDAPKAAKPFMLLGRKSLFIYLVHQPLLLALLYAAGVVL